MPRALIALLCATVAACSSTPASTEDSLDADADPDSDADADADAAEIPPCWSTLDASIDQDAVMAHVEAIARLTTREGGTRQARSAGFTAAADYVCEELGRSGYRVTESTFPLDVLELTAPVSFTTVEPTDTIHREGLDFELAHNTGTGTAEAPVTFVDVKLGQRPGGGDGCSIAFWEGFPSGNVALLPRSCPLQGQLLLASLKGASAVIVFNDAPGTFHLGVRETADLPVLVVSEALGRELRAGDAVVRIEIAGTYGQRDEPSILAEIGPTDRDVVMIGAHLDSVPEGPGINDNATGTAAVLEIAARVAACDPPHAVRVALWGGEELGLLGSAAYVDALDGDELERIRGYVNLDMLGSPNFVPFIGDGDGSSSHVEVSPGSDELEALLTSYLAEHRAGSAEAELELRSDYAPFMGAGVPIAHLFAGAEKIKTPDQAARWGGEPDAPYDACYHLACDDLENVDRDALGMLSSAAAHAVSHLLEAPR